MKITVRDKKVNMESVKKLEQLGYIVTIVVK